MFWNNPPTSKEQPQFRIIKGVKLSSLRSQDSMSRGSSLRSSLRSILDSRYDGSQGSNLSESRRTVVSTVITKQAATLEQVMQKHWKQSFVQELVEFMQRDWVQEQVLLMNEHKTAGFIQLTTQKCATMGKLIDEFLGPTYSVYSAQECKMLASALFKQSQRTTQQLQHILKDVARKLPDQTIISQQDQLQQICSHLLQLHPLATQANLTHDKRSMYFEEYTLRRNKLKAEVGLNLKPMLNFILEVEKRLEASEKQLAKMQVHLKAIELEKDNYFKLLSKKQGFIPVQIDYDKLHKMRLESSASLLKHFDENVVRFHNIEHNKNELLISELHQEIASKREEIDKHELHAQKLIGQLNHWENHKPELQEAGTQAYLLVEGTSSSDREIDSFDRFLTQVATPFGLNQGTLSNILNILTVERVLTDYQAFRNHLPFKSWREWVCEWFLCRTGCKKIAQVMVKNLEIALKELNKKHKRFEIFTLLCGFGQIKSRNLQEDLQYVFFQSSSTWAALLRLALIYRGKLNSDPSGYPLIPPIECEDVFKLPLRKSYEAAEQFLAAEGLPIPPDLTQKIDHYAINQISRFKSGDATFQKENQEEIHILRELNFDILAGYLLESLAHSRTEPAERFMRAIHSEQLISGAMAYPSFQLLHRRFYKQKRAKIEYLFAQFCLNDQLRVLDLSKSSAFARALLDDTQSLRVAFEKIEPLKALLAVDKAVRDKKPTNTYELFRERYYNEMYDFYSVSTFLEKTFSTIRPLLRLKAQNKPGQADQELDQSDPSESDSPEQKLKTKRVSLKHRMEDWHRVVERMPHFSQRILTIEQLVVHSMRRKDSVEICELAWRTLRQLLAFVVD